MKIKDLDATADVASDLLKALASPVRLKILCQLIEGERSVGQIAAALECRDTLVSQHLALLRRDRIVQPRRAGQTIFYAISSEPARRILDTLYGVFCGPNSLPLAQSESDDHAECEDH